MPSSDDLIGRLAPIIEWAVFRARRIAAAAVAAVLCFLLLSWGWNSLAARGKSPLQGRVSVAGRAVTFGTVTVMTADGATITAPIQPDGTYALPHVPPGPIRVAVSSPEPKSIFQKATEAKSAERPADSQPTAPRPGGLGSSRNGKPSGGKNSAADAGAPIAVAPDTPPPSSLAPSRPEHAAWFRIPGRYANPMQSGLVGTVERRGTKLDLDLQESPPPGR